MPHNYASSLAYDLRKHLADEAGKANTWATEGGDGLHSNSSYYVGPLAYYQHAMNQLHTLFSVQLEQAVRRDGLTAEQVAEGLADHGVDTTAEQLRQTYPQIVTMERHVQWMSAHADTWLPLLYRVSRLLPTWPVLLGDEYRWTAENTAGCISAALADTETSTTPAGLRALDVGMLMQFAPTECTWITRLAVDLMPEGRTRDTVASLVELAEQFYEAGREQREPANSTVDLTEDPLDALARAVRGHQRDRIELHHVQPVQ